MKTVTCMLAGAALIAFTGLAHADDHLAQAQTKGLAPGTVGSTHVQDNGAGQGSPFIGHDTQTPSSDQGAEHANVKPRTPK